MIELTLPDMTCGHCVRTVTQTVQKVDPQATVQVDLGSKRVQIASTHPVAEFSAALVEQGYTPA